jgi:hypothetical protein
VQVDHAVGLDRPAAKALVPTAVERRSKESRPLRRSCTSLDLRSRWLGRPFRH